MKAKLDTPPKPTKLETAVSNLNVAAAKLEEMLPEDLRDGGTKMDSIQGYADLHTLTESLASVMETMMLERNIDESNKPTARAVIISWVQKALPFIEQGLSVATVCFHNILLANNKRMPFQLLMI
jgi:hypothetical protein